VITYGRSTHPALEGTSRDGVALVREHVNLAMAFRDATVSAGRVEPT
jgi:hypothetical protein